MIRETVKVKYNFGSEKKTQQKNPNKPKPKKPNQTPQTVTFNQV